MSASPFRPENRADTAPGDDSPPPVGTQFARRQTGRRRRRLTAAPHSSENEW
jgi:hypothetical protein